MNTATEAQRSFITKLLTEREVPTALRETITAGLGNMPRLTASTTITHLLTLPKPVVVKFSEVSALLETIPKSKYAIPRLEVPGDFRHELLFVEVKQYRGTTFMRRLSGAPGYFSRIRIDSKLVVELAKQIATDPLRYTQMFAKHYSVCGCCAAELTDDVSRALGLGPVCRKRFNL